jgi:hypothetical protein
MSMEDLSGFFLIVETKSKLMTSDSPSFNHITNSFIGREGISKKYFYLQNRFLGLPLNRDRGDFLLEPNLTHEK